MKAKTIVLLAAASAGLFSEVCEARTWTSRSGKFTVEAELLDYRAAENVVVLKRDDNGKVINVRLELLSLGDAQYVKEALSLGGAQEPSPDSVSPFEDEGAAPPANLPWESSGPRPSPLAPHGWRVAVDPGSFDATWISPDLPRLELDADLAARECGPTLPMSPILAFIGEYRAETVTFDLRTGKRIGGYRVDESGGQTAVSPDGTRMAYAPIGSAEDIEIYSLVSQMKEAELAPDDNGIRRMHFLDDSHLAMFFFGNEVSVWDIAGRRKIVRFKTESSIPEEAVFTPGGHYLIVDHSGFVIYDMRTGTEAGRIEHPKSSNLYATAVSPDGKRLAALYAGYRAGVSVHSWDLATGRELPKVALSEPPGRLEAALNIDSLRDVSFSWLGDGSGWLIGGRLIVPFESGSERPLLVENLATKRMAPMLASGEWGVALTGSDEDGFAVGPLNAASTAEQEALLAVGGKVEDAGLPMLTATDYRSAPARPVMYAAWNYDPRGEPVARPAVERVAPSQAGRFAGFSFARGDAPQLALMVRRSEDAETLPELAERFDLSTGRPLPEFKIPYAADRAEISPDGRLIVTRLAGQTKGRLDVFEADSGRHLLAFRPYNGAEKEEVTAVDFLDEAHLVTQNAAGDIVVWSVADARPVYRIAVPSCNTLAVSADGATFFAVSPAEIHVFDAEAGACLGRLEVPRLHGPGADPTAPLLGPPTFSPDGKKLAALLSIAFARWPATRPTASEQYLVVWDLARGEPSCVIDVPGDSVSCVWADDRHVLLYDNHASRAARTALNRLPASVRRKVAPDWNHVLVSIDAEQPIWRYTSPPVVMHPQNVAGRIWHTSLNTMTGRWAVQAGAYPDPRALAASEAAKQKTPMLAEGFPIAVVVDFKEKPGEGIDKRAETERLIDALEETLLAAGYTIDDQATSRLTVTFDFEATDEEITNLQQVTSRGLPFGPPIPLPPPPFGRRSPFGGSQKDLIVTNSIISCTIGLAVTGESPVSLSKAFELKTLFPAAGSIPIPEGETAATVLRKMPWQSALQWCRMLPARTLVTGATEVDAAKLPSSPLVAR